ncbi:hypothetical protein [Rubrivirga sp. IMCC43871]|uniref:hypothetical protein n=1 Tax=Rubrivirga sp. IMCC43871 TaxID=3391575 RepID=UPI00398FFA12
MSTTLVECPARSTFDVWDSSVVGIEAGHVLVYESFECRSPRIHEFDASGTLVRTDSTDVPRYLRPAVGGFYATRPGPQGSSATLVWFGPDGERRDIAALPAGTGVSALDDGSFRTTTSGMWTRIDASGGTLWSAPVPAGGVWRAFDLAPDGGAFVAGCTEGTYCGSRIGRERVAVRLGPSGAVAWTTTIPWDGVTAWAFEAVRALPDGGALALGGAGDWLYGRTPDDAALSVVRFGPDGAVAWERQVAGWGRLGELVRVTDARVVDGYLEVGARHFDPTPPGVVYRYVALVLSADDGAVVSRSPLGAEVNGYLEDLGDGRWARAAHGGTAGCPRGQCSGNRTLEFQILR